MVRNFPARREQAGFTDHDNGSFFHVIGKSNRFRQAHGLGLITFKIVAWVMVYAPCRYFRQM